VKVTFDLDSDLYRAVRVEAARDDRSIREVIAEALDAWLEKRETEEDVNSAATALEEYQREGGLAAEEFFRHHAAETRATYGAVESEEA
jgi:plasmid stability protein